MDEGTDIEHSEQFANLASSSEGAAVASNANANYTYGPVHTIRNINIIKNKTVHGDLQKNLDAIQAKIATILKSRNVVRAVYSAQIEKGCMDGTRVQVILEIETWIKDLKGPQIFWLAGMAGTGKSAIAWTVCSRASKDLDIVLAGSFFCSRSTGVSAQRDVRCVIPTLAQLLALQSTKFAEALAAELTVNPGVLDQQVGVQVEKLLYNPLLALKDSLVPILFVIDALDECGGQLTENGTLNDAETHRTVSDMLAALVTFSTSEVKLPVKFFVTSRPETHIRDTPVSDASFSKVLRLHTVDKRQITADIRLYISNRLLATPILRALFTDNDVDALARISDDLFIVAATALEHALSAGPDVAAGRFKSLLDASQDRLSVGAAARLDGMYAVIIEDAAKEDTFVVDKLDNLLRILGALLSVRMTLSIAALADLLDISIGQLRAGMTRLHAVIYVPESNEDASLRPIHASFGDYLFGRASDRIRISKSVGHETLAHGCFHVLAEHLHFNVSQSRSSFEPNPTVKPSSILLSLEYASLQWIYHVSSFLELSATDPSAQGSFRSRLFFWMRRTPLPSLETGNNDNRNEIAERVNEIIRPRLLFWLEVMSVLGQIRRTSAMLMFAAATFQTGELSRFLRDASSFVASSQEAITRSAPHIYLSALPFADKSSLIWQDFSPLYTGLITVEVIGIPHHAGRLVMTLTGHEGAVTSIGYSHDGRYLGSASRDGTVRIWDMRTGEEKMTPLRDGDAAVLSVAWAPDDQCVISGTESGDLCVWSLIAAHVSVQRLRGHCGAVAAVSVSPNTSRLASASLDQTVRLWDVQTSQQVAVLLGHTGAVHALAFSSDSLTLASGSQDGTILLWDVAKGKLKTRSPHRHEQPIHSLCFLSDGQKLAAGCGSDLIICKPQTGKDTAVLYRGSGSILSTSSPSNGTSLVWVNGMSVSITTVPRFLSKPSTLVLDGHTGTTRSATFSPNDLFIASASDDRTIRIWNAGSTAVAQSEAACDAKDNAGVSALLMSACRELAGHSGGVMSVSVSPDGTFIVSGGLDHSVRVWDAQTGAAMLPPLLGHTGAVSSVGISSDGHFIASGSFDNTFRIWDAQTGNVVGQVLTDQIGWVSAVARSADAWWLASGSGDGAVYIWDVMERTAPLSPFHCDGPVYTLAFSPDGRYIAVGHGRGCISIWQSETAGQLACQSLHTFLYVVSSICFSPDGAHIVSSGRRYESEHLQIWNISTREQVFTLVGHAARVSSVAYSPDGRFIGTGSEDRTVRLWDAATGAQIAVLTKHSSSVQSVAFMPNGQSIVSGSGDRAIHVWDITNAYGERSASDGDLATALNFASLHNGWLQTPSGELLLWVPLEYRQYLRRLEGPQQVDIMIGKSGWHCGKSWTSCWHANKVTPATCPT